MIQLNDSIKLPSGIFFCPLSVFQAILDFFIATVIPFIRQSRGKTLGLRPTSMSLPCVWFPKIIAYYLENEHFLALIPKSLLWIHSCDGRLPHDHWRALGSRSNFSLPICPILTPSPGKAKIGAFPYIFYITELCSCYLWHASASISRVFLIAYIPKCLILVLPAVLSMRFEAGDCL